MCGRARLSSDVSEIKIRFSIPPTHPTPNFAASWNVATTDPLLVVGFNPKDQERGLTVMRWGLVPFWAKDIKVGFSNINAKAEGIETKPAFREAFRQRRCPVPVGFVLRMEKDRDGEAALRDRARRRPEPASRLCISTIGVAAASPNSTPSSSRPAASLTMTPSESGHPPRLRPGCSLRSRKHEPCHRQMPAEPLVRCYSRPNASPRSDGPRAHAGPATPI
jgi:putative SOS response-associated peptidase YedK